MSQGQISRLESRPPPRDLGRLVEWARLLRIPERYLWFKLPDDPQAEASKAGLGRGDLPRSRHADGPVPPSMLDGSSPENLVATAADTSLQFISRAVEWNVNDETLEQLRWELGRVAVDHVHAPLDAVLRDLVSIRDLVFGLLRRRQTPRHARDLYLLAGTGCALLANASHNVGDLRAALVQVRAALTCADLADHDGLRAWARGTAAVTRAILEQTHIGRAATGRELLARITDEYHRNPRRNDVRPGR